MLGKPENYPKDNWKEKEEGKTIVCGGCTIFLC
jgi:hypothetical protein